MTRIGSRVFFSTLVLLANLALIKTVQAATPSLVFANGFESNTSTQIAAARAAPDGSASLAIDSAFVTYVKSITGNDVAGFFIQADVLGPALYVAVDPATISPSPLAGDRVSFVVTAMGTSAGLRQAIAISGYSRSNSGNDLSGLVQGASPATDLVAAIGNYESELISLNGVVTGAFVSSGAGFDSAVIATTGISGDGNFRLRLPTALRALKDLQTQCSFELHATPMWRFNAQAQPSAWGVADINVSSCPAPTVVGAVASSVNSVVVHFTRLIGPASVQPDGSQFAFDNGLLATSATVSGDSVIVSTTAQMGGQVYTVTVANTVLDTLGSAVQTPDSAMFPAFAVAAQVRINEVNANISSGCDLVELRVMSAGSMAGIQLFERTTSVLTFTTSEVQAGDRVVVHFGSGNITCASQQPGNETVSVAQYSTSTFPANYDAAWDWWSLDQGITNTDNVLTVYDNLGQILDAVFLSDDPTGTAVADTETQAASVAGQNEWTMVGGGIPLGGFIDDNFNAHAVQDLNGTSTSATGVTIQRKDNADTNTKADWEMAENTWGVLNSGQTP